MFKGNIRRKNNKIDCKQSNSRSPSRQLHLLYRTINNKLFTEEAKKTKTIFKIQKEE